MSNKPRKPEPTRHTLEDLQQIVEKSGYPFEIDLLHMCEAAGFSATHGTREWIDDRLVDVDVTATTVHFLKPHESLVVGVRTAVVAEAKVFHAPKEFVGFESTKWPDSDRLAARFRVAGLPNFGVLEVGGIGPPWWRDSQRVVEPLLGGVWCGQWGVLEPKQEGKGSAHDAVHHPPNFAAALTQTISVMQQREANLTRHLLREARTDIPAPSLAVPLLAIDVPSLHVYNTERRELRCEPWITLYLALEINGQHRWETIDVVCRSYLPTYLGTVRSAAANFAAAVEADMDAYRLAAAAARLQHREENAAGHVRSSRV